MHARTHTQWHIHMSTLLTFASGKTILSIIIENVFTHNSVNYMAHLINFARSSSKVKIKMNVKCEVLVFFSVIVPSKLAALMTSFIYLYKLTSETTNEVTICEYKFRAVARTDSTNVTGSTLQFLILAWRTVQTTCHGVKLLSETCSMGCVSTAMSNKS
jgi:hypothetical protein